MLSVDMKMDKEMYSNNDWHSGDGLMAENRENRGLYTYKNQCRQGHTGQTWWQQMIQIEK